jgi:hypothetical protein
MGVWEQLADATYSFWASMIMRALSLVEAVDGVTPTSSRNDFAMLARSL